MEAASLINISYGERCENKKIDVRSPPRKEHYQGWSETKYNSSLHPDLGASPELGRKGFQTDKAPDITLDASGVNMFNESLSMVLWL